MKDLTNNPLYKNSNCPTHQDLENFANETVNEVEKDKIQQKLNLCSLDFCICADTIEGIKLYQQATSIAKENPELQNEESQDRILEKVLPYFKKQRKIRTMRRLTFLVAASVGLFIFAYLFLPIEATNKTEKEPIGKKTEPKTIIQNDSLINPKNRQEEIEDNIQNKGKTQPLLKKEQEKNLLAFAPNEELELRLENTVRGNGITGFKPRHGTEVNSTITFSWQTDLQQIFTIEVLDNRQQRLAVLETKENATSYIFDCRHLKEGLYYWILSDDENVYYVGKFKKLEG